ncbi:MAG TPA: pitrilysin family protein [Candidatus Binatia bacterium]|nr:pitrilysin family protein [Candidatus Binatia bacterium]
MRSTCLPNGVRILSQELPDFDSVTVGIWVENGSRYERPEQAGISHFLEHLFFKGTERRTAAQIAEEIDAVGGVLNAFTGKEYTCYYAKVLREHLPLALDLLADLFTRSRFAEEEIERERSVIIQEISQAEDTPDDYVHELFNLAFWSGHPLSRPIAGTAASVSRFTRADFLDFLEVRYRPNRVLICGAGSLRHEHLADAAARHFGALSGTADLADTGSPVAQPGVAVHEKPLEQVHLCLGAPGIAQADPDRYAAHLLNLALGGGMSSRLFQEIREKRGKAYTVYSFLSSFVDAGYVGVYVGTSAAWVREVVDVIRAEIDRITRGGLERAELGRTKNQMKGNLLLALETSDSRMSRIAKNEIYFGRDVPVDEVAAAIDAVTNDDVVRVAERLFRPRVLALTVLGDLKGERLDGAVLGG